MNSQPLNVAAEEGLLPPQQKISFSELKIWNECAFKHKLVYVDGIKNFTGNHYTAFGTALHHVCEVRVQQDITDTEAEQLFKDKFIEELKILEPASIDKKMSLEMVDQGKNLVKFILPELKKTFENFEVVSVEEQLFEGITEFETDFNFKGFIDLVIKTPDGKYHIIDWKTCSWGWSRDKKSDPMTTYQLTYYKNYFSKKHNIDPKLIETHFALLKRTAKTNNVEIMRVTSGPKKVDNSLKVLQNAVINIENKNYIKNRLNCKYCKFYKTEYCR